MMNGKVTVLNESLMQIIKMKGKKSRRKEKREEKKRDEISLIGFSISNLLALLVMTGLFLE